MTRNNVTGRPRGIGAASRRDFLKATAGAGALAAGIGTIGTASAAGIDTPWLHRDGNLIRDPMDNQVILRGVNVADAKRLNVTASARGKNAEQAIDAATTGETGWHANIVRLPVQPWDVAELPPVPMAWDMSSPPDSFVPVGDSNGYYEPPLFSRSELETYVETHLVPAVQRCVENDVYCIVDYHRHWGKGELAWATLDEYGNPKGPNPQLDEEVRLFWDVVAEYFADVPNVLFEVYNEPTKPGWGPEDVIWNGWRDVCQPWVDIIREHAPRNLILIGNPRWTRMPWGIKYGEFEGDNLAYTYHVYPGHAVTDFDDDTGNAWEQAPLFVTEWGYEPGRCDWICGNTQRMGQPFKDWASQRPVHWTAWCYDPVWLPRLVNRGFDTGGSTDAIGDPYSGTIPEYCTDLPCEWTNFDDGGDAAGEFVRAWLAETRNQDVPQVDYDPDPPVQPPNLTVTDVTQTSIDVSWDPVTDPGDSPLDYHVVYLDGEQVTTVPADTQSAVLSDLLSDVTYEVGVTGVDVAGNEGPAATVTATTDAYDDATPPGVPGGLTVDGTDHRSLSVSWNGVSDTGPSGLHHYNVYVDGTVATRVGETTTSVTIDGLVPDASYDVAVSAVDTSQNESARSNAVTAHTAVDRPDDDDLVLHEFDAADPWPDGNLLGNTWTGTSGITTSVADSVLTIEYTDGGWFGTKVETDLSAYPYCKIRLRGASGGEESQVRVRIGETEDTITNLSDDAIGTEMSLVTIDMDANGVAEVPAEFRFFFGGTGTIEVDAIWFDANEGPTVDGGGREPDGTPTPEPGTPTPTATDTPTETETPTDTPCSAPTAPAWSDGTTPRDVDGDGVYEDMNGNCEFDSDDVVRYFQQIDRDGIQTNPSYYDANGNGNADFDDIVTLFQSL